MRFILSVLLSFPHRHHPADHFRGPCAALLARLRCHRESAMPVPANLQQIIDGVALTRWLGD